MKQYKSYINYDLQIHFKIIIILTQKICNIGILHIFWISTPMNPNYNE